MYVVLTGVAVSLEMQWLLAFIWGILISDLYVNRHLIPASLRKAGSWFSESVLVAWGFWGMTIVCGGLPNYGELFYAVLSFAAVGFTLISQPTQRFLSNTVNVFLGKVSFSLYLVHVPVIFSVSCWIYLKTYQSLGHHTAAIIGCILGTVISLLISWLFYRWIDAPSISVSRKFSDGIMRKTTKPANKTAMAEVS